LSMHRQIGPCYSAFDRDAFFIVRSATGVMPVAVTMISSLTRGQSEAARGAVTFPVEDAVSLAD
jgi:hypothetical protein